MDNTENGIIDEGVHRELEDCQDNEVLVQMLPESTLIGINIICRLCANPNERIIGIYSEEGISNELANKMNTYLPIKVSESDSLPLQCCWNCASTVLAWHELVVASVEADRRLRELQTVDEKQIINEDGCSYINDDNSSPENTVSIESKNRVENVFSFNNLKDEPKEKEEYFCCTLCNIKFSSETILINHYSTVHEFPEIKSEESFICAICKSEFQKRWEILKHIKTMHSNDTSKNNHIKSCNICNDNFSNDIELEKHLEEKHVVDSASQKETVQEKKTEIIKCETCSEVFEKKSDLNKHLREHHGQKVPRVRRHKSDILAEHFCDICGKGFTRKFDMQKHRKSKHPNDPKPEVEPTRQQKNLQLLKRCRVPSDDNKNYYKCEICDKMFRQSYNFMRHQTVHTGVRAFFCHICGKNFRVSGGLHRHITEHHYGVKKYNCDVCGKSFAAKATRDDHKNIHTNDRPFICDICGKAFRQKASLHIHKLFHGDNYRFTCEICGKKYRRASELKIHSWLHTGHKPHQCSVCDARFRLSQDLKRHIKIHDKLNECVCNECGSIFSQERYLKNHKKAHMVKSSTTSVVAFVPQS